MQPQVLTVSWIILETLASVPLVTWCQLWFGEVWNTIFQHRAAVLHSPPFTACFKGWTCLTCLRNDWLRTEALCVTLALACRISRFGPPAAVAQWFSGVVSRCCFEMDHLENSWSPLKVKHTPDCQVVDRKCVFFHILSARRGDSAEVLWLCRCFVQDQGPPRVQRCGKLQLCSARTLGASQHCPS